MSQAQTLYEISQNLVFIQKKVCLEACRCNVTTAGLFTSLEVGAQFNYEFEPEITIVDTPNNEINSYKEEVKAILKQQWTMFLTVLQQFVDGQVNNNPDVDAIPIITIFPVGSAGVTGVNFGVRSIFKETTFKLTEVAAWHYQMLSARLQGLFTDSPYALSNKLLGAINYPIEVPESLLNGYPLNAENPNSKKVKLYSLTEVIVWFIGQFDSIIGQFPVEIEIDDIDPFTAGNQSKLVKLPNLAEAIAEIYGLAIKGTINSEVLINLGVRTATEIVSTKNAVIVTQDYARGNAAFLGYKGNPVAREITYALDLTKPNQTGRVEDLLKSVKANVQGWQEDDNETVVGYLQKLMFSAGIIKAVFFRGKKDQKRFEKLEIKGLQNDQKDVEKRYDDFIKKINNPTSPINIDTDIKPEIDKSTP